MDNQTGKRLLGYYLIGSGLVDFVRIYLLGYIAKVFYMMFEGRDNAFIITLILSNLMILVGFIVLFLYFWRKIRIVEDRGIKLLFLIWSGIIILLPLANALMLRAMTACANKTQMMSMEFNDAMLWAPGIIIVFAYVLCIAMTGYYFGQVRYAVIAAALFIVYFKGWYDSLLSMTTNITLINVVTFLSVALTGILVMISCCRKPKTP